MKLYFYTTNSFKFRVARELLEGYDLELSREVPDFKEVQAEGAEQKVLYSLGQVSLFPAMAEDSGLYIPSLRGFPGPITSYVQEKLNAERLLKLLEGRRREATLVSVAGIRTRGETRLFEGRVEGRISSSPSGSSEYWIGELFIPSGWKETVAERGLKIFLPVSDWHQSFTQVGAYLANKSLVS